MVYRCAAEFFRFRTITMIIIINKTAAATPPIMPYILALLFDDDGEGVGDDAGDEEGDVGEGDVGEGDGVGAPAEPNVDGERDGDGEGVAGEGATAGGGQAGALQFTDCVNVGHGAPPLADGVVIVLVCVCVPVVPQVVALHGLRAPHEETEQSIGQGGALQLVLSLSVGHAVPPLADGVVMVRVLVFVPVVPHADALHGL